MWTSLKIIVATIFLLAISTVVLSENFLKAVLNDEAQVEIKQQTTSKKIVTVSAEPAEKEKHANVISDISDQIEGPITVPIPTNSHINIFEHRPRTAMEARIESALTSKFDFDLPQQKLSELKSYIELHFKIPVYFLEDILEEEGILLDDPVPPLKRDGITLHDALFFTLRHFGLTYIIKHNTLMITTETDADSFLVTRIYDFSLIMNDAETMMDMLRSEVAPDTWSDNGGEGEMTPAGYALVIRTTQSVHQKISKFLTRFHQHLVKTQNGKPYEFYEDPSYQNNQFEFEEENWSK